ncbi:MAG: hypothetical protein Barrevirus18_10 [Barrevirus sp.]|uniref:Amine oxidase domain-containing protein n=1 Tax=Barrevirus sp. TaxID=2487763 RepID=A0A3G4ZQM5_9VIRU|nr:MAG: hypothetical protein Barrevirus18_10 [Barrevirus sp.]
MSVYRVKQMNNIKPCGKVSIFGAGIGGLTVAHYLTPYAESIDIYEKNSIAGGLARSEDINKNECDTTEISWRVYFHFYKNLFDMMKEIPSYDGQSVFSHLTKYHNIFIPDKSTFSLLTPYQKWKIATTFALSKERLDSYDDIPWRTFIGTDTAEIPQWLGMDRFKGSTVSVQRIGFEQALRKGNKEDYVLDNPTNKVWFDPWTKDLEKRGIRFHFNSPITSISVEPNTKNIIGAMANQTEIKSDLYIVALPIEVIANLIPTMVPLAKELSVLAKQIQVAFQFHIETVGNKVISFGNRNGNPYNSFLIRNSPWALIIESKTISWITNSTCKTNQWSITACQANVPGILIKKPLIYCTEDEAVSEIIAQLINDSSLIKYLQNENPDMDIVSLVKSAKWTNKKEITISTYKFNNNGLQTDEPKFSNNTTTKRLRPHIYLGPNAFLATAYTSETIDIFSMEAATISGKLVAATIMKQLGHPNIKFPELPERPFPILNVFREADRILFLNDLPDIITFLMIIIIFIIVIYIIYKFIIV